MTQVSGIYKKMPINQEIIKTQKTTTNKKEKSKA